MGSADEARDEHGRWASGGGKSTDGVTQDHRDQAAQFVGHLQPRTPTDIAGSRLAEGDRVRITGNVSIGQGRGRSGTVSQISPGGEHVGVRDSRGQHLGYFHTSDVRKRD